MKARIIAIIGILVLLTGSCIPSLFPLYTKDDLVFDDRIIGTWDGGEDGIWTVKKQEFHPDSNFPFSKWSDAGKHPDPEDVRYMLTVKQWEDGDTAEANFELNLLVLDGQMYADFFPDSYETHHGFLTWHMVETHNFSKIKISADRLRFDFFDPGYFMKLIDQNRIRISHIMLNDFHLLTAPTKDLQRFLIKYANEDGALLGPDVFQRI